MNLPGIGPLKGLDKIPGKTRFCTILGANSIMDGSSWSCPSIFADYSLVLLAGQFVNR
jgi:hypothetical protein